MAWSPEALALLTLLLLCVTFNLLFTVHLLYIYCTFTIPLLCFDCTFYFTVLLHGAEVAEEPASYSRRLRALIPRRHPHPLICKAWALLLHYLGSALAALPLAVQCWHTFLALVPFESWVSWVHSCKNSAYDVLCASLVDRANLPAQRSSHALTHAEQATQPLPAATH